MKEGGNEGRKLEGPRHTSAAVPVCPRPQSGRDATRIRHFPENTTHLWINTLTWGTLPHTLPYTAPLRTSFLSTRKPNKNDMQKDFSPRHIYTLHLPPFIFTHTHTHTHTHTQVLQLHPTCPKRKKCTRRRKFTNERERESK